jgi:hypothetical protein
MAYGRTDDLAAQGTAYRLALHAGRHRRAPVWRAEVPKGGRTGHGKGRSLPRVLSLAAVLARGGIFVLGTLQQCPGDAALEITKLEH